MTNQDQEYYTIDQFADLFQISRQTVARYIRSGDLEAVRFGEKNIRIPREAVQKFLKPAA